MQPTDSKTSVTPNAAANNSDTQTITIPPSKKKNKPSPKVRRRLKDAEPLSFTIDGLSHDGRGVAVYGNGFGVADGHAEEKHGKKVFVSFALPGEIVEFRLVRILAFAVAVICSTGSQRVKLPLSNRYLPRCCSIKQAYNLKRGLRPWLVTV